MTTADQKIAQIRAILADTKSAPLAAADTTAWYSPTEAEKEAFCTKTGFQHQYVDGYPGTPEPCEPGTWQRRILPLAAPGGGDLSEDQIKEYHGMGFTIDGIRACWTAQQLTDARRKCHDLELASSPEAINAIAGDGAYALTVPVLQVLIMGAGDGATAYFGPLGKNPTITNAANYCVGTLDPSTSGVPVTTQPGPGLGKV